MILSAVSIIMLRLGITFWQEPRFCVLFSPPSYRKLYAIIDTDTNEYLPCIKIFAYVEFKILKCVLSSLTFRGLLHDMRMSFVQERVHTGCHIITSLKFIRIELFMSEFMGVFITERNTHSERPFLPVQCKRGTALIFVWILCRSEGSIEKDRKGYKHLFLLVDCCHSHTDKT